MILASATCFHTVAFTSSEHLKFSQVPDMPVLCSQAKVPKGSNFALHLKPQGTERFLISSSGREVQGRSSWQWWLREGVGVDRI